MGKLLIYKPNMPEPTAENPYAQVEWIFREKMLTYENKHTQGNYQAALTFYIRFLRETNNYNPHLSTDPRFYLAKEWDSTALVKLERWLEATNTAGSENYLTSSTITGNFSAVRLTMEYAFENSYIPVQVFSVVMPGSFPETEQRAAYTDQEYNAIFNAVAPHIRFSKGLLNPYRPTGVGRDPRIYSAKNVKRSEKLIGQGWSCWQKASDGSEDLVECDHNIRWYFENVMKCLPLAGTPKNKKKHVNFFQAALRFGGLNNLYRKWGVSTFIDHEMVVPLIVELVAETALNVESVLSLRRDCFLKAHPLTGLPYLQYYKLRSGGEKELPLSLYDQNPGEKRSVKLGQKQSQIIARTIDAILKLTEPLVANADDEDKEYLFLHQIKGKKKFGRIERVTNKTLSRWTEKIVSENDLRGRDGKPLIFNLSRFRPTKFTKMVQAGHDIFHIMAIAGHASVTTTLGYIDKLGTTGDFHKVVQNALIKIKNNKHQQERRQLPIANQPGALPGKFIFKGTFCDCKNPYDPPEQVKKTRGYRTGDACTNWNMCLSCENVLITEQNLPKLWAYRSEIDRQLTNGVADMPRQGELYKKAAAILDQILAPDELFSKEVLDNAAGIAADQEYETMDAFVY